MNKFIRTYSDFILNETLVTHNIDLTYRNVKTELSLFGYNFSIEKTLNNVIELTLHSFDIEYIKTIINHIDSLLIDRHGWFPSKMILYNLKGMETIRIYDEDYLIENIKKIKEFTIIYESKYDIEINSPVKLYHLSIKQYESKVLKMGLIPKSKSKLSKHLDRIYLCNDINHCYSLIPKMKANYMFKSKRINSDWIIYEIDNSDLNITLYKDPNYEFGYYTINNIKKDKIKIIDEE